MKLLIVDDSLLVRMQLRKYISAVFSNTEIEDAVNGIEALEKHRSFKPDVIILDYIIPVPDGLAVLKILRSFDKQVKFIVISTLGNQLYVYNKFMESGASSVLAKPITKEFLLELFNEIQKYMSTGDNIEKISR